MKNCIGAGLGVVLFFFQTSIASAEVQRAQFKTTDRVLTFEILRDDLLHFDFAPNALPNAAANEVTNQATNQAMPTTPIIFQTDFPGPTAFSTTANSLETARTRVTVDLNTLCFSIVDKKAGETLTQACPSFIASGNSITLAAMKTENLYGLGEQFQTPGVVNGDWSGKIRVPGSKYGNSMTEFAGGHTGNTEFPILYALGPNTLNYAFFLDTIYPYQWDFTASPWKITQTQAGSDRSFRGYFFLGDDLPTLRSAYLDLVGRPPVPPKKAFGLWISEFGYRNWPEIEGHVKTLRANHFPVDGFVLDLYWFGQYIANDTMSAMGRLTWDTENFPNPLDRIARFKNEDGIGLMTIEESYVSAGLANYTSFANRGFFVNQESTGQPLIDDAWWGKGAGIDWTNPAAGAAWHNELRKKQLTDLGVNFHWTDLGEPEAWDDRDHYANPNGIGHAEADGHNLYNFYWDQSIDQGYRSNHETARHFIMSRSGSAGMQRFGAAMWSGDIGSNLRSLSGHLNVQMNMSLSGLDYFGADIGGFNRLAVEGDIGDVYTRWLANASLFDVPMRPHADDGSKKNFTAPDRIGDLPSNLANLRQRYELAPYYYSLAYQAYRHGLAVVPPLVYYFQADPNVRQIADQKMIGPYLMAASSSTLGEESRTVYLPAGDWIDYRNLKWFHSTGQTLVGQSLRAGKLFELPLFARAGAILPLAQVDDRTMNVLGKRTDGSVVNDLRARIFASGTSTDFHLVEDDGTTEAYQGGQFAETVITQNLGASSGTVTFAATTGSYTGAPASRIYRVEWIAENKTVNQVRFNATSLTRYRTQAQFDRAKTGWFADTQGTVHAKSAMTSVAGAKAFEFSFE